MRADVWLSSSQTKLMDFRYFIYYSSFVMFWIFFLLVEKWLKLENQFEVPFDGGGVANGNPVRCRVLTWDFREISRYKKVQNWWKIPKYLLQIWLNFFYTGTLDEHKNEILKHHPSSSYVHVKTYFSFDEYFCFTSERR